MPQTWPVVLQDLLNEANFGLTVGNSKLESDTEIAEPKVRNRYTKAIDEVTGSIELKSTSEYTSFDAFYKTTLSNGTLTFYFNHPITQVQTEFRFRGNPQYSSLGGGKFRVSFTWVVVG